MARIAVAMLRGARRASTEPRDRTGATMPRGHLFDETFSTVYDESSLDAAPALRLMNRRVPPWVQLALEVQRRRDEYDAIVTWGERLSLALMAIQSLTRQGKPHVPMQVLVLEAQRAAADARLRQEPAGDRDLDHGAAPVHDRRAGLRAREGPPRQILRRPDLLEPPRAPGRDSSAAPAARCATTTR